VNIDDVVLIVREKDNLLLAVWNVRAVCLVIPRFKEQWELQWAVIAHPNNPLPEFPADFLEGTFGLCVSLVEKTWKWPKSTAGRSQRSNDRFRQNVDCFANG
jgi:hypothetical protein